MINYWQRKGDSQVQTRPPDGLARRILSGRSTLVGWLLFIVPILYLTTLARGLVLGDPTEYTFVANILGIAHPPGYAFITLLGKLFQTLIPFGSIPWRMHLLSAAMASLATLAIYSTVLTLGKVWPLVHSPGWARVAALFAALAVGSSADHWQHGIHANPHIITAAFLGANLYFLTKWGSWRLPSKIESVVTVPTRPPKSVEKWLYLFCISAGLGMAHHPLTVFAFPAYALFILWLQPTIWRQGSTLFKMLLWAWVGLSAWLYFPIRSPMQPAFGPSTMHTLDGFLDHVLARGLSESLPYYTWVDLSDRLLVFWTLLRLQYTWPVLILSLLGLAWLSRPARRPLLALYLLAFLGTWGFVISLKAQDIMAYLLGPFMVVGLLAGVGALGLLSWLQGRVGRRDLAAGLLFAALFAAGPIWQVGRNLPHISLRDYEEGDAYVEAVFAQFTDTGQGAVLLNDWEHMTPLWYVRFVENRWPDEKDVRPVFVSAARTWLENVFDYLPGGPVYLSDFRREIVDAGFRLRPVGSFHQVVEPGDKSLPPGLQPLFAQAGELELVGFSLPQTAVAAGEYIPLTLAMRASAGTDDYYVPVLYVGDITYAFTTDSHLVTPSWMPSEIIVERFDFALPLHMDSGVYPVSVDLKNLSLDQDLGLDLPLGELSITNENRSQESGKLLANFRQRVGLVAATARGESARVQAPWPDPVRAKPGEIVHLTLRWQSLAPAEESYTIFVHLIDLANRPIVDNLDYTPLGGAFPTHLWIPKWLPGQQVSDPYRLQLPADLVPGTYRIEVGLYEMVGKRRLHMADESGNLIGDRYILGDVIVGD